MTIEDDAELWWSKLSPEARAALVADPAQALDPALAGEVQRAGLVLTSDESDGEVRTLLPPRAVEYVRAQAVS